MKKPVSMILIALVALIGLNVTKNAITKGAIAGGVRAITGLKLGMRGVSLGVLTTRIGIKGLKMYNPDGFEEELMASIPEIYVNYSLLAFLKGRKVHLEEMRLNLEEFVVVKNADGKRNIDALKVGKDDKKEKAAPKKKGAKPEFQIDKLQLKIGKVIYKDYSRGTPPKVSEYNLNIDETYENIENPQMLIATITTRALLNTAISKFADFGVEFVDGEPVIDALNVTKDLEDKAKEAAEKASEALKGLLPLGE